jgi:hypothetical protein
VGARVNGLMMYRAMRVEFVHERPAWFAGGLWCK